MNSNAIRADRPQSEAMMSNQLVISATERSPDIQFDFLENNLTISGESYPEDVVAFYEPVLASLRTYLGSTEREKSTVKINLIYFNSSSAKVLMTIMDMLDDAATDVPVDIYWYYDPEDDTMQELGEEFGEDIVNARFSLKEITV